MDEEGGYIVNPTQEQVKASKLDLVVAGTAKAILMVEAGASEVSETVMLEAFDKAHEVIVQQCAMIERLRAKAGKEKTTGRAARIQRRDSGEGARRTSRRRCALVCRTPTRRAARRV